MTVVLQRWVRLPCTTYYATGLHSPYTYLRIARLKFVQLVRDLLFFINKILHFHLPVQQR